jgi:hypothetical protein
MADIRALVAGLPGPDKLGKGRPAAAEPDEDDGAPPEYGSDEDEAAEVSACDEFLAAAGIKGADSRAVCSALKNFITTVTGPTKE